MGLTTLLRLQVSHSYFTNQECQDIRLTPDEKTLDHFKGYRLSWKFEENALQIAGFVNDQGKPTIPIAKGTFVFHLYQTSRYLREYTIWPEASPGQELVFENAQSGEGKHTLLPAFRAPEGSVTTEKGFLANLLVHFESNDLGQDKIMKVTLSLQASAVVWKYYYIGRQYSTLPDIKQVNDEITFSKQEFETTKISDTDEPLIQKLGRAFPDSRLGLYQSTEPVTWREAKYPNIQLKKEGEIIYKNLQNPSWKTQGVEIINSL